MNERIIVTGKNGVLSSEIAKRLSTGNINAEQLSVKNGQWENYDFKGVDHVVHVAGIVPGKEKCNEDFFTVNAYLTHALAKKCKEEGVKHFVYISSMAVYGISQSNSKGQGVVFKNTSPNPNSDYGKSKLMAENFLLDLQDENFSVAIVRVPSIYGKGLTEYIEQYLHLVNKLPVIPNCFKNNKKSFISVPNLCELIYLIVTNNYRGIICPDEGTYTAVDVCSALKPSKRKSRFLGLIIEMFLRKNARIIDYYGRCCYDDKITEVFDGKYRVVNLQEMVKEIYE